MNWLTRRTSPPISTTLRAQGPSASQGRKQTQRRRSSREPFDILRRVGGLVPADEHEQAASDGADDFALDSDEMRS